MPTRRGLGAIVLGVAAATPRLACAQAPWPGERPVDVIVPFPPGGGVDIMARSSCPSWRGTSPAHAS